jgi:hypothetical protein
LSGVHETGSTSQHGFCDLFQNFCHTDVLGALNPSQEIEAPFAQEYFLAAKALRHLLFLMLGDLANLAPALATEVKALEF